MLYEVQGIPRRKQKANETLVRESRVDDSSSASRCVVLATWRIDDEHRRWPRRSTREFTFILHTSLCVRALIEEGSIAARCGRETRQTHGAARGGAGCGIPTFSISPDTSHRVSISLRDNGEVSLCFAGGTFREGHRRGSLETLEEKKKRGKKKSKEAFFIAPFQLCILHWGITLCESFCSLLSFRVLNVVITGGTDEGVDTCRFTRDPRISLT